jgi:hypothetical protein
MSTEIPPTDPTDPLPPVPPGHTKDDPDRWYTDGEPEGGSEAKPAEGA